MALPAIFNAKLDCLWYPTHNNKIPPHLTPSPPKPTLLTYPLSQHHIEYLRISIIRNNHIRIQDTTKETKTHLATPHHYKSYNSFNHLTQSINRCTPLNPAYIIHISLACVTGEIKKQAMSNNNIPNVSEEDVLLAEQLLSGYTSTSPIMMPTTAVMAGESSLPPDVIACVGADNICHQLIVQHKSFAFEDYLLNATTAQSTSPERVFPIAPDGTLSKSISLSELQAHHLAKRQQQQGQQMVTNTTTPNQTTAIPNATYLTALSPELQPRAAHHHTKEKSQSLGTSLASSTAASSPLTRPRGRTEHAFINIIMTHNVGRKICRRNMVWRTNHMKC